MLYKTLLLACARFYLRRAMRQSWLEPLWSDGFYPTRRSGPGRLRMALNEMPPAAGDGGIHLNSPESHAVAGKHPKPSAASRSERGSRTASAARHRSKGCPTRAMLAAITDPLTVALGGAKPLPNQASQWQGWSVTDLRTDGGWRRGSLVVNGDGLGADAGPAPYKSKHFQ